MRKIILTGCVFVLVLAFSGLAGAAITPIDPFTGDYSEGFESFSSNFVSHYDIFGGHGTVDTSGGSLHTTAAWSYSPRRADPYEGERLMGALDDVVTWAFDVPAEKFGGYFMSISGSSGAAAYFYDIDSLLLGSSSIQAPSGVNTWAWDGWSFDTPVKYLEIHSSDVNGFIMHDDMQYTPAKSNVVPEPSTLFLIGTGIFGLFFRRKS